MATDGTDDDSIWLLPGAGPGPDPGARTGAAGRVGRDAPPASGDSHPSQACGIAVQSGDLLVGRFKIGSRIGQGGMGTIYEAYDTLRDGAVAIKVLVPGLLQDGEAISQFKSEAAIAMRLSHPQIVTVYDFYASEGIHAIVMERLHGKTLRDEIRGRKSAGIPFSTADIGAVLAPVCLALDYAHASTVHRDVKPENIWIGDDGSVKLMDFGLAMLVQRGAAPLTLHTLSQLRLGSPYYMAPEQLQDARQASAAADQFAVGVVAYELLSGSLPIGLAKPLRELRPDLPYPLTDAIDRALANDPQARFPSVAAFWDAFQSGRQSRRSLRQHLDTRPVLRKSVVGFAVVGSLALLACFVFLTIDQRATTLLAQTGEASNALQSGRLEISKVCQLVDGLQRAHLDAESELKAVHGRGAPDGGDIPARLHHEIALERAEQKFAEVDRASRLLEPRLGDGRTPFTLTNVLADLEGSLRAQDFRGFALNRAHLDEAIANEQTAISRIRALAASQVMLAAADRANADGTATAMAEAEAAGAPPISDADLEKTLAASLTTGGALAKRLEAQFETLAAAYEQALARWQSHFPKTGPPPIEFLGHPTARAEAAADWRSLKRYDRASTLLIEAAATLNGWAKEVEDLHARSHQTWVKAQAEGRAFESATGLRFVRIGDGPDSYYWSMWETRVMDFAWFAHYEEWGSENAGTFWKDPGFPIGPTSPVVGIEPETVGEFGRWIVPFFRRGRRENTYVVPTIKRYEALLAREPAWQASAVKRAVFPDKGFKSRRWQTWWADPDISAERHIRPVGLGAPSAQGLYDLFGNAWEWAADLLPSKGQANHFGRDYEFHALYGGGSFGQIGSDGWEPIAGHVFVGRHDALGFRLIIDAQTVDGRLRNEAIMRPE